MHTLEDFPYVVATGEIAEAFNQKHPHDIWSINQLIEDGATRCPDTVVAAMPAPSNQRSEPWQCTTLTFQQLLRASTCVAKQLSKNPSFPRRTAQNKAQPLVVGLLAASSLDFLINWLAILQLGCASLLIAPQCSPDAVAFLLSETKAAFLLHDQKNAELATSGLLGCTPSIESSRLRCDWRDALREDTFSPVQRVLTPQEESETLAVIFHSSGSTGMPKPIYQKHAVWTRALPHHPGPPGFTTTPLYHGGMSDLLRSLMSDSCTYLFTDQAPITAANILASLKACDPAPSYFLAVPYVLKLLAEDPSARTELAKFDMISVGGAPLPDEIGDEMVQQFGWNLVSRLGSSECGFLMSSWRDFDKDLEWSWLRVLETSSLLKLEPFEEQQDLCELIVAPDWPTLNKTNRDDGSYASGDLYQRHPHKNNAWRYAGRADDVLVLSNGEKASPGNIESTLRSCRLVNEVVVFGSNRPAICAFIFIDPSREFQGDVNTGPNRKQLLEELSQTLRSANAGSPTYAQLQEELTYFSTDLASVPRTSKGTIRRSVAEQAFEKQIDFLFEGGQPENTCKGKTKTNSLSTGNISELIQEAVSRVCSRTPGLEEDLFDFGLTSLQSMRVRSHLTAMTGVDSLSTNVVFEHPSCKALSTHVKEVLAGGSAIDQASDREQKQMEELVTKFSHFNMNIQTSEQNKDNNLVVLTGATGSLGAFILSMLLERDSRSQVICLCRATSDSNAQQRVVDSLRKRKCTAPQARIRSFKADLNAAHLGLSTHVWQLCSQAGTVIHSAWPVNFRMSLSSFQSQISGLQNLLQLCLNGGVKPHFVFCSSIASVLGPKAPSIAREEPSHSPGDCGPVGYSQSKWVAEAICVAAAKSGLRVDIARLGQLCGDTVNGVWNQSEAWPLMVKASADVGAAPALDEFPSWLPVDLAAGAIFDLLPSQPPVSNPCVSHIYNGNQSTSWKMIVEYFQSCGVPLKLEASEAWLQRLDSLEESHPAAPLRSFWAEVYNKDNPSSAPVPKVETKVACELSQVLASAGPIKKEWVQKFVQFWVETGFIRKR